MLTKTNSIYSNPIINQAIELLEDNLKHKDLFSSQSVAYDFLRLKMENYQQEHFAVMYLDNQSQLIEYKELFIGTVNAVSVYTRDVIRHALLLNSVGLILAHNHPSGEPEPSNADRNITRQLAVAAEMFEMKVLDHFVIGKGKYVSFAERGWL